MYLCRLNKAVFNHTVTNIIQNNSYRTTAKIVLTLYIYTLLPYQTYSNKHILNFSGKRPATLQLMREGCSYKYPPLPINRHSFIEMNE